MPTSPAFGAHTAAKPVPGAPRSITPIAAADRTPARRRTLGRCAHCGRPVDVRDEYVRLYRRAWHLDCALAADDTIAFGS